MILFKLLAKGLTFFAAPLFVSRRTEIHKKYSAANDKVALMSDWLAVGNDFREVLKHYGK